MRCEQEERDCHSETRENRDRLLGVIEDQSRTIAVLPATAVKPTEVATSEQPQPRGFRKRLL